MTKKDVNLFISIWIIIIFAMLTAVVIFSKLDYPIACYGGGLLEEKIRNASELRIMNDLEQAKKFCGADGVVIVECGDFSKLDCREQITVK